MQHTTSVHDDDRAPLDRFALQLQQLRARHDASFNAIAQRVTEIRLERGLHEAAARVPRSTVYHCFSTGRARIDTDLLRDVVLALTGDAAEAEAWVARYLEARARADRRRRDGPASAPPAPRAPRASPPAAPARTRWPLVVSVLLAAALADRLGEAVNTFFGFSLFLDMIGTCFAAIALGPWYGVCVAIAYQGVTWLEHPDLGWLFTLVNVTGALVWGYGVRRFGMGANLHRFTLLGLIAALACSAVGIPINMVLSAMGTASGLDLSVHSLESLGLAFGPAIMSVNLTASIIDKLLASFIALVVYAMLHRRWGMPAAHMPLVRHLGELRVPVSARA